MNVHIFSCVSQIDKKVNEHLLGIHGNQLIINKNLYQNIWKAMKINNKLVKSIEIYVKPLKSIENLTNQWNQCKSLKIDENHLIIHENQ